MLAVLALSCFGIGTLPRDANGVAMQTSRTFVAAADTVVTVADSIAVPVNSKEVTVIVKDQAVYLTDGLSNRANSYWVQLPAGTVITLPVLTADYIRYKSLTGTAKLYFIWRKI
jgi:hypothetical protein